MNTDIHNQLPVPCKLLSSSKGSIFRVLAYVKTNPVYNSVTVLNTKKLLFTGAFPVI